MADISTQQKVEETTKIVTRQKAKEENITKMPNEQNNDIAALVKLLTAKLSVVAGGANKVENTITEFDGEMAVEPWLNNFENNAAAYGWIEQQKFVYAMNKMTKTAKILIQAVAITSFKELKKELLQEFGKEFSSEEIHKQLRERRKKEDETNNEYILRIRQLGKMGNVDDLSLIKYIIDDVNGKPEHKIGLYGAKNFTELKRQLEIFDHIMQSSQKNKFAHRSGSEYKKRKEHCFNCGSTEHKRAECSSTVPKCFKCGKNGHISRNCDENQSRQKNINYVQSEKKLKKIAIDGIEIDCLIDTGAEVSLVKYSAFKQINGAVMQKTHSVLKGLGNKKTFPVGEFVGEVAVDTVAKQQKFVIVQDVAIEHKALLGYDFTSTVRFEWEDTGYKFSPPEEKTGKNEISIYNIVDTSTNIFVPKQFESRISRMIENYKPEPQKKCPVELKIIPEEKIIHFRHAPSRLPAEEENAVNEQVQKWLEQGFVRKSTSYVASRVVAVREKNGAVRVCIDYRKLNSMVLKDCFPVPVMEDVFTKLQAARYFTTMDLENGFFHVPIEEDSRKYTAFVTKEGLFEFCVAPFGFCNSPAVFIRLVNHIFQQHVNNNIMELYMDDIIIFAATAEECLNRIKMVLQTAAEYNLKIKWEKCHFMQTKIEFLGHIIEGGRIWPGHEKTDAVKKFKIPTNVKTLQSFLGLTGFFRRFIPGYANIARPLTNLLKKDAEFKIAENELNAILQLKEALTKEPVLKIYERNALTELHTDASKEGFGGVLLQACEGQLHPVFYWSRKATEQDSRKHSYILEVKAAFLAIQKFRNYLLDMQFKLVTDCVAFKGTTTKKDIPREVAQWIIYMQDFDFTVEHRAGEKLRHADSLSRYPQEVLIITSEVSVRIKKAQEKDDHIRAVMEILKTTPYEDYRIKAGILYKSVKGQDVLVVPKLMEMAIIKEAHNIGHFAIQKTMHNIQQNFWIPHLEGKVRKVITNCIKCIMHNAKLGRQEGFLQVIEKGEVPLYTLHVDHLGPMDATGKQYKYIFAMLDGFSKFVWLYPTKTTGVEEVIKKISEWKVIFGNPMRLVSDRGPAFTSNVFADFMKANIIEHILTTTGVARGNGQIERVNRSILSIIAKLSADDTTKWYKFVQQVQVAINSHIHGSTKKSPFQLLFGVKMRNDVTDDLVQMLEYEAENEFDEERQRAREDARKQIQQAQTTYKRNYDKKRKKEATYKMGDLVAIKRTQFLAGKKLASKYLGPYTITKVKRGGRYDVQKSSTGEGPNQTSSSMDNMKLWKYVENNEDVLSSGSDEDIQDGRM